ncbi:hypothetical protein NE237_014840 [Protea cynaroides]|uniref:CTLH domain-containing protein n=1 Tax=Protea cynaroides TaxID=273540 RepID=A0A9Q0KD14_9MAGN|nr:hypothetical protein NE237_014840 [Protea cynaroides]
MLSLTRKKESGITLKSSEFLLLESQILDANWDDCITTLDALEDLVEETRASASFQIFRQCILECLNCGDDFSALAILRKHISALGFDREKVYKLVYSIISSEEMRLGSMEDSLIRELRLRLLVELEKLLPPPIAVPGRRLEHLLEMVLTSQLGSCIYHNSSDAISLYEDHCCGRNQILTETAQVGFDLLLCFLVFVERVSESVEEESLVLLLAVIPSEKADGSSIPSNASSLNHHSPSENRRSPLPYTLNLSLAAPDLLQTPVR